MLMKYLARVLRVSERKPTFVLLFVLALLVASSSSCAQNWGDRSPAELIAIVQKGEYDAVRGKGPACDAAYNLGLRKATEAVDVLVAALSGPAVDCMATALGLIGDVRAVEPLLGVINAVVDDYQLELRTGLFEEDKDPFGSADEALVAIGTAAVDPLLAMAARGSESMRDKVTYVLGRIADPRAEEFLIERLKTPNATTDATGLYAAEALARTFGDEIERLMPLLQSKETVAIAYGLVGLGRAGTEAALGDALMQFGDRSLATFYLNSGNPLLRSAALDWAYTNGYELAPPTGVPGGDATPGWGDIGAKAN